MIKRDFLLRLIERAGPMLKKVLSLRQADKKSEAYQALREAARSLLGIDLSLLEGLDEQSLCGLIALDESQADGKIALAARLLEARAELLDAEGHAIAAAGLRAKAAALYARAGDCAAAVRENVNI